MQTNKHAQRLGFSRLIILLRGSRFRSLVEKAFWGLDEGSGELKSLAHEGSQNMAGDIRVLLGRVQYPGGPQVVKMGAHKQEIKGVIILPGYWFTAQ